MRPIIMDPQEVENTGEPLGTVYWQGRDWCVTSDGIERRDGCYVVERDRLREDLTHGRGWIHHIAGKRGADIDDFATAFLVACSLHGVRLSEAEVRMLRRHVAGADCIA